MTITTTKIVVSSTGQTFTLPGAQTVEQIRSVYSSSLPAINSMDAQVTEEGEVRTITFVAKTGTKGAIDTTKIVVSSTGQTFTLPGAQTVEQIRSVYSSSLPAINSMDAQVTEDGNVRTITFVAKTGTKGAIDTTKIVVSSTGQTFTLPGAQTVEQIRSVYSSSLPAINSMDAQVTEDGNVRTITFVAKTGTKG